MFDSIDSITMETIKVLITIIAVVFMPKNVNIYIIIVLNATTFHEQKFNVYRNTQFQFFIYHVCYETLYLKTCDVHVLFNIRIIHIFSILSRK